MQVWPKKHDPCLSTKGYSAPEFIGRCFDATAPSSAYDSFATGVILLELLCGKGSFDISRPESPCTGWLSFGVDANAVETAMQLTRVNASQRPSPPGRQGRRGVPAS
ncbi:unnamed protein product [Symbiodinium pilosum]|uniref:Protein kinase domain-containing protein n=1 Tax=Symbiodinium pilosum TaxID=2952 RepID=A0A812PN20_SYMPI|nr:unnamed protein product [Symbiodinium pilosum]